MVAPQTRPTSAPAQHRPSTAGAPRDDPRLSASLVATLCRAVSFEPLFECARMQLKQVVVEITDVQRLAFPLDAAPGRLDLHAQGPKIGFVEGHIGLRDLERNMLVRLLCGGSPSMVAIQTPPSTKNFSLDSEKVRPRLS